MTNIDLTKSELYTLSIRLSADGFSFYIHHPSNEDENLYVPYEVNASYSMTANLKEMLAKTHILKHTYKRTNILIDSPRVTFVPFDLYEDEHTETFFYHNFNKVNNEIVLCNILGKSNTVLLFGMDKHAHQLLSETFPTARFFACSSPQVEFFANKSKEQPCRQLYTYLKKETLEIHAFDKGKLLLTNIFNCKQTSDQVYYLLYVWQQLGYSQTKDQLWLIDQTLTNKEELQNELRKYLRQVSVLDTPYPNLPFDLQTLLICE